MVIRIMSKFELKRICKTLNATLLTKLSIPTNEDLGSCKHIYQTEIGDIKVIQIEQ